MYINTIKNLTRQVKDMQGGFTFIEDEVIELLIAIGDYLAKNSNEEAVQPGYLSVKDFAAKNLFISPNTVWHYCTHNKDFAQYVQRIGNKFYVEEHGATAFFMRLPHFKGRIKRFMDKEKCEAS